MDTGATGHFFKVSTDLDNIMPTSENTRINVSLTDGTVITITHTGNLRIPNIPLSARQAHVSPHLVSHSLLSISQLCAHGCKAIFTDTTVTITFDNTVITTGTRSTATGGLWTLTPIPPSTTSINHLPNNAVKSSVNAMFHTTLAHDTITNRIAFYHATCYSPVLSTWCAAIDDGHFTRWSGLTSAAVKKHLPASMAMHQGHLDQTRMNARTTQRRAPLVPSAYAITQQQTMEQEATYDTTPPEPPSARTRHLYVDCHATTGIIFTDPTGIFLTPSTSGNQYIPVVYGYDGNLIHAKPMLDHKGPSIITSYKQAVTLFESHGFKTLL
jgi:hypothetical protein